MHGILYFTLGCHLCELAEEVITLFNQTHPAWTISYRLVDIAEDEALMEAYGVKIPVLRLEQATDTLNWPFTVADVADYRQRNN